MSTRIPLIFIVALTSAMAQAADATAPGGARLTSFAEIMDAGGWPMYGILGLSVVGVFLVIFFLFTFRIGVLCPKAFVADAQEAAGDGDLDALRAACAADGSPASRILKAATEQLAISETLEYMAVRDAVEDEGGRQANALWQRLQFLMDVAVIAPMVGLLGTVLGMLESFSGVQTELGAVRPASLSQGVARALITTAGGLIVGILAMVLYALFRARVNQLLASLEETCSLVIRRFMENYRRRQGNGK